MSQPDGEAFEAALRQAAAGFNESARQLVALIRPGLDAATSTLRNLESTLDAQWPQWREFAASVPDDVPEPQYQACHCFCGVVHGLGLGVVCTSEAEPDLFVAGSLEGRRLDIPVCRVCFDARALVTA